MLDCHKNLLNKMCSCLMITVGNLKKKLGEGYVSRKRMKDLTINLIFFLYLFNLVYSDSACCFTFFIFPNVFKGIINHFDMY